MTAFRPSGTNRVWTEKMVKFLSASLNESQRLWIALQNVYGIGPSRAKALCYSIGATPMTTAGELRAFHIASSILQ